MPANILLVEDNPADVELTKEAFKQCQLPAHILVKPNGMEALEYLRTHLHNLPNLILLDLNLPRWDGKSLLRAIKSDRALRRIPVIVLTTSNAEQDVLESYDLHANCYIVKSLDIDHFFEKIRCLETFWLDTVLLPSRV
jgi:CheY-like chemotaxis protein